MWFRVNDALPSYMPYLISINLFGVSDELPVVKFFGPLPKPTRLFIMLVSLFLGQWCTA